MSERQPPVLRWIDVRDRPMVTIDLDVPRYLSTGEWDCPADLKGAIIRVRGEASESEAEQLNAGGGQRLRAITDALLAGGAHKVIGPSLTVRRERRARSEVTVDTSPQAALATYLKQIEVDAELVPRVVELAGELMGA